MQGPSGTNEVLSQVIIDEFCFIIAVSSLSHKALQAREEGIREAGKQWSEQKLEMQNHILQLQEIISHLQVDTPVRPKS